jgi:hypothetical protein
MIAIVTVVSAFGLGYFMRSGLAANLTYAVAYLWAFTFQTLYLLLDTEDPDGAAFSRGEFPWQYGLVTLTIFVAGFGLVALGHRVRSRRRTRTPDAVATRP